MSKQKVRVIACLKTIPEHVDELKAILYPLIEVSRQDKGCIQYVMLQNRGKSTHFAIFEEWENQSLLEEHIASPHIQGVIEKIDALLSEPPDVGFYNSLNCP